MRHLSDFNNWVTRKGKAPSYWSNKEKEWKDSAWGQARNRYSYTKAKGIAGRANPEDGIGLGFIITGDNGIAGIDLDGCIVDGRTEAWAQEILDATTSYAEVSPSGTGIKIFGFAHGNGSFEADHPDGADHHGFEVYFDGRHFTVTEDALPGRDELTDISNAIEALRRLEREWGEPQTVASPLYAVGAPTPHHSMDRLRHVVLNLPPDHYENEELWIKTGMAIKSALPTEEGFQLWDELSRLSAKYDGKHGGRTMRQEWERFGKNGDKHIGYTWLFNQASQANPFAFPTKIEDGDLTDTGNAKLLVSQYGRELRYNPGMGWVVYEGGKWQSDSDVKVIALMQKTAQSIYEKAARASTPEEAQTWGRWARQSLQAVRIKGAIEMAKPMLWVEPDEFDYNPELLNVKNGVVNLRTGEFMEHNPNLLLTQQANVNFREGATCPKWEAMIDMVFGGDKALVDWIQACMGWTASGRSDAKALFFMYGPEGNNGKSTIMETLANILGDYALKTSSSAVMAKRWDSSVNSPFLVKFRGKRFVYTSETEDGQRWATGILKDLTGGDMISAAAKHKAPIEFKATHSLWVYGNEKPIVDDIGDAFWERLKTIPFNYAIPKAKRRPMLEVLAEFEAEASGILNWLIAGYQQANAGAIQRNEPDAVMNQMTTYRLDSDPLEQYLSMYCVRGEGEQILVSEFAQAYNSWYRQEYGTELTTTKLTQELSKKGIKRGGRQRSLYVGVSFKQ